MCRCVCVCVDVTRQQGEGAAVLLTWVTVAGWRKPDERAINVVSGADSRGDSAGEGGDTELFHLTYRCKQGLG